MTQTRQITFAESSLTIEFDSPGPARVIGLLYDRIPTGQPGTAQLTYRLLSGAAPETVRLYRDKTLLYQGDNTGLAAELLLSDSCYNLAAQSKNGLLFHAAALSWRGRGLILPGASGAGKSTLTAWLLSQGFSYMTDELVYIPWQTDCIQAFTRPINLKSPARSVLNGTFDFEKQATNILSSPYAELVPLALFDSAPTCSEAALRLIIFPRYQTNSQFEFRQLSKAQAGLTLMQTLINARNLPEHGFVEVARLVRHIPAYVLRYGSFAQVDRAVKDLLTSV